MANPSRPVSNKMPSQSPTQEAKRSKEGHETSFLPLQEVIKIVNNNKMKIVFLYILNLKEIYFSNII